MSARTTRGQLQSLLRQLAAVTLAPMAEPWKPRADGRGVEPVGGVLVLDSYKDDGEPRLYRVEQMIEGGGVTTPLGDHRFTAGELWHVLRAAINAVRLAIGEQEFALRMRRAYPDPERVQP